MGSSEFTSRYTAQVTEDTAFVPAGVVATRPFVAETLPDAGLPADRPQAELTSASVAAAATATAQRFRLQRIVPPRYRSTRPVRSTVLLVHDLAPDPGLGDHGLTDLLYREVGQVGIHDREVGVETLPNRARHRIEAVHPGAT